MVRQNIVKISHRTPPAHWTPPFFWLSVATFRVTPSLSTATDHSPPLASPHISFTLNSKHFSLNNPFLLSLLHQLLAVLWPLDLANGFHLAVIFHFVVHFHLVHLPQCLWISLPSVIADWQALYRHTKSPPDLHSQWSVGQLLLIFWFSYGSGAIFLRTLPYA